MLMTDNLLLWLVQHSSLQCWQLGRTACDRCGVDLRMMGHDVLLQLDTKKGLVCSFAK